ILGYKVISSLLEAFVNAAANAFYKQANNYDKLILQLMPEDESLPTENIYQTLLNATCFVASLSDGKAMLLAEKIGFK
ncbi:MAG: dGTPase, partial [Flavobacteriaceae bacterium]|nr:dGTPase [Flavobacteriaceae bacterium]